MKKQGFTLIEMLTTCAIMVIVFALLTVLFSRATIIHRTIRNGGDAENYGIYLLNTILYGPGTNWDEGLIGAQRVIHPEDSDFAMSGNFGTGLNPTLAASGEQPPTPPLPDNQTGPYYYLGYRTNSGKNVLYRMAVANTTTAFSMYRDKGAPYDFASTAPNYFDVKPNWAKDRGLELTDGGFYYYDTNLQQITTANAVPYYVGIRLVLRNTVQNLAEAVTLYRCVRVRNIIKY